MSDTFVGVDVAKAEFVVACRPGGPTWTATNDPAGIAATVARLRSAADQPRLSRKRPGGYRSRGAGRGARGGGAAVGGRDSRQVRDFAKATGQLAKTDRLDADLLARFAERVRPRPVRSCPSSCNTSTPC